MHILLDIGNTNIVVGLYKEEQLIDTWRMLSDTHKTADEYQSLLQSFLNHYNLGFETIDELVISSVVPHLTQIFIWLWKDLKGTKPFIIHPLLKTGMKLGISNPQELGSDLLVGAVAAYHKYKTNCIILDMGTATTVSAIKADGTFLGVSIISGLELTVKALLNNTALLNFKDGVTPENVKALGMTTETAIQSGIIYGYTGLVDNIIENVIKEINVAEYKIITTGGQARIIANFSKYIEDLEPNLLFEGMQLLYQMNK